MAPTPTGMALTPKAIAIWTAVMTLLMAACTWGLASRVGPIGPGWFTVGFVPMFVAVIGLSWSGRFDRLLPAALAALLVATWPVYRGFAVGDWAAWKEFLIVAGTTNVLLLMFIVMDFAKRRGWVSDSPARRRLVTGSMFVYFIFHVIGWPTGAWQTGLLIVWLGVSVWGTFWPDRRRPSRPGQPATT